MRDGETETKAKNINLIFVITENMKARLDAMKSETGTPIAEFARRAVKAALDNYEKNPKEA